MPYCLLESQEKVHERWEELIHSAVTTPPTGESVPWDGQWTSETPTVFSRPIPLAKTQNGTAVFSFSELCAENLGPADYITLTSTFHTLFIHSIPPLTPSLKNEVRRFISLLDEVYESGVRLCLRLPCPIEELFFHTPTTTSTSPNRETEWDMSGDSDPLFSETFSETYKDTTLPFRPNVASTYTPRAQESVQKINFTNVDMFKGTDERFAAKRAESRLWEFCSDVWWRGVIWKPLRVGRVEATVEVVVNADKEEEKNEGREGVKFSPHRRSTDAPPRFGMEHFWTVVRWGRKAGEWG
ncbi:hypothetical protein L873DRAFT_1295864, partial [Choiromyces venosus 120613-1]